MEKHRRNNLRPIAIAVILAFTAEQAAMAAPALPTIVPASLKPAINFRLPESVAVVDDSYKAPGDSKLLILIQDAHTNDSGQMNVARALDEILPKEDINTVFTEADSGDVSVGYMKPFFDKKVRQDVARKLVRKGEMRGHDYANLVGDRDFTLWGVEDPALYLETLKTYQGLVERRDRVRVYLDRVQRSVETLKNDFFAQDLKNLDALRAKHNSGDRSLADYSEDLLKAADAAGFDASRYANIKYLRKLRNLEKKIDFKAASSEEREAMKTLPQADREELLAVHKKKGPQAAAGEDGFYALFADKLNGRDASFPNLRKYFDYLKEMRRMNALGVVGEIHEFEEQLFLTMAKTRDEAVLWVFGRNLEMLQDLIALKVSPEDFNRIRSDKSLFDMRLITGFLNRKIADLDLHYENAVTLEASYDAAREDAFHFYDLTLSRDRVFMDQVVSKMEKDQINKAVLITGGYHSPNLKAMLRGAGYSYVSLLPQVLAETDTARYEKLLLSQIKGLDADNSENTRVASNGRTSSKEAAMNQAMGPAELVGELVSGARLGIVPAELSQRISVRGSLSNDARPTAGDGARMASDEDSVITPTIVEIRISESVRLDKKRFSIGLDVDRTANGDYELVLSLDDKDPDLDYFVDDVRLDVDEAAHRPDNTQQYLRSPIGPGATNYHIPIVVKKAFGGVLGTIYVQLTGLADVNTFEGKGGAEGPYHVTIQANWVPIISEGARLAELEVMGEDEVSGLMEEMGMVWHTETDRQLQASGARMSKYADAARGVNVVDEVKLVKAAEAAQLPDHEIKLILMGVGEVMQSANHTTGLNKGPYEAVQALIRDLENNSPEGIRQALGRLRALFVTRDLAGDILTLNDMADQLGWDAEIRNRVIQTAQKWFGSNGVDNLQRAAFMGLLLNNEAGKIRAGFDSEKGYLPAGTAGTRGRMENLDTGEIGPNFVSSTTVMQYVEAFIQDYRTGKRTGPFFIAREVRDRSDEFKDIMVRMLTNAGIPVVYAPQPLSTPFASFFTKYLQATYGLQISASHNNFADNGIKYMGSAGEQLMPHELDPIANAIPGLEQLKPAPSTIDQNYYTLVTDEMYQEVLRAYFDAIYATLPGDFKETVGSAAKSGMKMVYTALNGVGREETIPFLKELGFSVEEGNLVLVDSEMIPLNQLQAGSAPDVAARARGNSDPAAEGLLNNAHKIADENNIGIVFANDPDRDRMVVNVKVDGVWRDLTGNDNGVVMGAHGFESGAFDSSTVIVYSHATTETIGDIARANDVEPIVVPVGFKYSGNISKRLAEAEESGHFLGVEESYGTGSEHLNDKDGLSGMARAMLIIAQNPSEGAYLWDYLMQTYSKFGFRADSPRSFTLPGSNKPEQDLSKQHAKLGLEKIEKGQKLGALTILEVKSRVIVEHEGTSAEYPEGFHDGYALVVSFTDPNTGVETRYDVLMRFSGTEPKFKAYIALHDPVKVEPSQVDQAIQDARAYIDANVKPAIQEAFAELIATGEQIAKARATDAAATTAAVAVGEGDADKTDDSDTSYDAGSTAAEISLPADQTMVYKFDVGNGLDMGSIRVTAHRYDGNIIELRIEDEMPSHDMAAGVSGANGRMHAVAVRDGKMSTYASVSAQPSHDDFLIGLRVPVAESGKTESAGEITIGLYYVVDESTGESNYEIGVKFLPSVKGVMAQVEDAVAAMDPIVKKLRNVTRLIAALAAPEADGLAEVDGQELFLNNLKARQAELQDELRAAIQPIDERLADLQARQKDGEAEALIAATKEALRGALALTQTDADESGVDLDRADLDQEAHAHPLIRNNVDGTVRNEDDASYVGGLFATFLAKYRAIKKGLQAKLVTIGNTFFGTSMLSPAQRKRFQGMTYFRDYEAKKAEYEAFTTDNVILTRQVLDGGKGLGVAREGLLKALGLLEYDEKGRPIFGAKATDIRRPIPWDGEVDTEGAPLLDGQVPSEFAGVIVNEDGFLVERTTGKEILASVAELKLLHAIEEAEANHFHVMNYLPIVSEDSKPSYTQLLERGRYLPDVLAGAANPRTYRQVAQEHGLNIPEEQAWLVARDVPVFDLATQDLIEDRSSGKYTTGGGHGQWGHFNLRAAWQTVRRNLRNGLRSDGSTKDSATPAKTRITEITSGDGLNGNVPRSVMGAMAKDGIPVTMMLTERTGIDAKGGVVGVELVSGRSLFDPNAVAPTQMVELAQAQAAQAAGAKGEADKFEKVGLSEDEAAYGAKGEEAFNTNVAAINETQTGEILVELEQVLFAHYRSEAQRDPVHAGKSADELDAIAEKKAVNRLSEIMAPNLIEKKVKGKDGQPSHIQMEGAMGLALLSVNRFFVYPNENGEGFDEAAIKAILTRRGLATFVTPVFFTADERDVVFTPIKTGFDAWFQMFGGFLKLNIAPGSKNRWRYQSIKKEDGTTPRPPAMEIDLKDPHWSEIQSWTDTFGRNNDTRDLESIDIVLAKGAPPVIVGNAVLKGVVRIHNESGDAVDLRQIEHGLPSDEQGRLILDNVLIRVVAGTEPVEARVKVEPIERPSIVKSAGARLADDKAQEAVTRAELVYGKAAVVENITDLTEDERILAAYFGEQLLRRSNLTSLPKGDWLAFDVASGDASKVIVFRPEMTSNGISVSLTDSGNNMFSRNTETLKTAVEQRRQEGGQAVRAQFASADDEVDANVRLFSLVNEYKAAAQNAPATVALLELTALKDIVDLTGLDAPAHLKAAVDQYAAETLAKTGLRPNDRYALLLSGSGSVGEAFVASLFERYPDLKGLVKIVSAEVELGNDTVLAAALRSGEGPTIDLNEHVVYQIGSGQKGDKFEIATFNLGVEKTQFVKRKGVVASLLDPKTLALRLLGAVNVTYEGAEISEVRSELSTVSEFRDPAEVHNIKNRFFDPKVAFDSAKALLDAVRSDTSKYKLRPFRVANALAFMKRMIAQVATAA
jgi:phosphomannomutase